MKKLFRFVAPYRVAAVLAPMFMMVEVGLDLLQPRLMARIIDDGVGKGDMRLIGVTCLIMLGTSVTAVIGGFGCTYFSSVAGQGFGSDLRSALFRKVMSLSFAQTDRFTTGSLITRLTQDVTQMQHILVMGLRMFVRQPVMCIGGCVMALLIDWRLALILLVLAPPIVLLAVVTFRLSRPMYAAVQEKLDAVNSVLQENLGGIRVVKAFDRADYENSRFAAVNDAYAEGNVRAARFMGGMRPLIMLIMNFGILAVLWTGGWTIRRGGLSVGDVMAMIHYLSQILFSILFASFVLADYARAKASADRINAVLDVETWENHRFEAEEVAAEGTAADAPAAAGRGALAAGQAGILVEFRDVVFRYPDASGPPVLDGVSATVEPGQTLAIVGATGAGKSTLVHLLPRFHDLAGGGVWLDGREIRTFPLRELRERMGIVLQESVLFSGTVADNIRWGRRDASDDELRAAAAIAQADDFIMSFQDGYGTMVGQRGVTLSGGQKQRVAIARALLKKPSLLILDDSTSALDSETERRLWQALRAHCRSCTVIMIAQRISSVRHADAILVLQDGRQAGFGTHLNLLRNCRVYQEIVESQTGESVARGPGKITGGR